MVTHEAVSGERHEQPHTMARYIHIKVVDHTKEDRPAVNVTVPLRVARWGMKMAQTFSPQMKEANLDWDSLTALLQDGATGEIMHVEDEAQHKTVDIWVE